MKIIFCTYISLTSIFLQISSDMYFSKAIFYDKTINVILILNDKFIPKIYNT